MYCLLGLPFDAIDMAGAVRRVREAAQGRTRCLLATPNLNFVVGSRADSGFRDSVINSDLSVADGMPVVWVARLLGAPIRSRVAGADLFEALRSGGRPLAVYLFGGVDGVAAEAARRLNAAGGGLACVGYESPGYGSIEELSTQSSIERINASGADFLVVALGAKKGQAWIERNRARLAVPTVSHLGAALNFAAGTVRRAPGWMQAAGLEWLWRIREELGLWRRYAGDGAQLLKLLATRILPLAWLLRRHRPSPQALAAATAELRESASETVLALRGPWTRGNLDPLREAFRRGALSEKRLRIDLREATYVDASFLGLLLLLYGARRGHARPFACGPVSRPVRKMFMCACVEFLLDGEGTGASAHLDEEELVGMER